MSSSNILSLKSFDIPLYGLSSGTNTFKISIEASNESGWKAVVGKDGVTLGMTTFGKSAPYKDIYQLFNLTSDEIVKVVKAKLNK